LAVRTRIGIDRVELSGLQLLQDLVSGETREHAVEHHQVRDLPIDGLETPRGPVAAVSTRKPSRVSWYAISAAISGSSSTTRTRGFFLGEPAIP
jgi:hypothetical protein